MKGLEYSKKSWIVVLAAMIFLTFILPFILFRQPLGDGDTYSHIFMTQLMADEWGVTNFFKRLATDYVEDMGLGGYPIGLWFHAATVSKITGLSARNLSVCLPVIWAIFLAVSAYITSRLFLGSSEKSILAVIFFMSNPLAVWYIGFYSNVFVLPFFLLAIYMLFSYRLSYAARFFIFCAFSALIAVSHSGTTSYIFYSLCIYSFLEVMFSSGGRRFQTYGFFLAFTICMVSVMTVIPEIYWNFYMKMYMVVSFIEKTQSMIGVDLSAYKNLYMSAIGYGNIFYWNVGGALYILFLETAHRLRKRVIGSLPFHKRVRMDWLYNQKWVGVLLPVMLVVAYGIALLPTLSKFSFSRGMIMNSMLAPLFWWGPIQCFLCLFCFGNLRKMPVLLSITFMIVLLPFMPFKGTGEDYGTGISRYLLFNAIIVSILASEGFVNLIRVLPGKKAAYVLTVIVICSSIVTVPIGVTYFLPAISEQKPETAGLGYLKGEASSGSITLAPNMRQRLEVYGGVRDALWVIPSNESYDNQCINDLYVDNRQNSTACLREYGMEYVIDSRRVRKFMNVKSPNEVAGSGIDRIYSSGDFIIDELNPQ